ncbi:MAG: hypothetical protein NTV21_17630 [Planctomycetota bacterium]|nr:hypothetical protein [Planctomycetota bacterium]
MQPQTSLWLRSRPSPLTLVLLGLCTLAAFGWARGPQGGGTTPPPQTQTQTSAIFSGGATADSNESMIAVTGTDVTGASVLYLVDTQRMRLAVYQAASTGQNMGVRFIGARRIELDMELNGYNDNSEYSFNELEQQFVEKGLIPSASGKGLDPKADAKKSAPKAPGGQ